MAVASVRYIVADVDDAIGFYCGRLGFTEIMHPAPTFAMLERGGLRLVLSAVSDRPGGGQRLADGIQLQTDGLDAAVDGLRSAGARFRTDVIEGVVVRQVVVEDPSGNPVELFEPLRPEAGLDQG